MCDRIIVNKRHNKCYKCHNKTKQSKILAQSSNINKYFKNNKEVRMNNPRYVDLQKHNNIIRIFSVNPRGFGDDTQEKIVMLKQSKERLQFDGVFFSSPDRKWNSHRIESLRQKMTDIG